MCCRGRFRFVLSGDGPGTDAVGARAIVRAYVKTKYNAKHQVVVVPLCGHNARCMFTAEVALPILFPKM